MPFSKADADAACNFFELVLKHTADEWWGKPFILAPWQEEAISQIFGQRDDAGNRLIEMAYLEVPKKTGKSELAAGIILFVLLMDSSPGCQIYGAASATRQALNVYRAACKMVEQSPLLKKRLRILRGTNRITKRKDPDSFYAAIAADGDLGDGVNPSFVVADEVHRWKTRKQLENWDVLSNGGITRQQTLTIAITTAGVQNESPLAWRLHEKTRKIQEGIVSDPKFFGRIHGAGPNDDPSDEKTWIKAIPSLIERGGFLPLSKIREKYVSMVAEGDLTSFKRYFLNIWDQKENRAIDMKQWEACPKTWYATGVIEKPPEDIVRPIRSQLLSRFVDRPCWAGVDVSFTTDLSAVAFVFPPSDEAGVWDILPFFWKPQSRLHKDEIRDGVPYRRWAEEGFLESCDGNVIDNGLIRERLKWGARMFDVREMCFDRYNTGEMSTQLSNEDGYICVNVDQRYNLSEATKKVLRLVATGKLGHGDHPVMRWNASCLTVRSDGNDNIKPEKPQREKDHTRVDGIAAAITAMSRALVGWTAQTSRYENGAGLRFIG